MNLTPCCMAWHFVSDGAHAPHSDQTLGPTPTRGRRTPLGAYIPSFPCAPPEQQGQKAKVTNCKLVLSFRSQFFHHLRHFSNQANEHSTTQRLGSTAKVRSSLRLATVTWPPEGYVRHRQRAARHNRHQPAGSSPRTSVLDVHRTPPMHLLGR